MQKLEVINFMKKIKSYYQNFLMEDYIVKEWQDRLKPYEIDDVYRKLDQHLAGELKDQIPKLHYILKYLKTPEEKNKSNNDGFIVRCNLCQREMSLEHYNEHYGRCLSTMYLMSVFKKQEREVEYDLLARLSEDKFNEVYEKYKDYDDTKKVNIDNIFKKGEKYDYS